MRCKLGTIRNKTQAKQIVISACKRQYGFAPQFNYIMIEQYNDYQIVFRVCGRQYIIKSYKDIPIVTLINFVVPYDF